jgi:aspartyl-tRNA(Asn)/glutamyl-tRNA(Gln) amidotransferase subunit A
VTALREAGAIVLGKTATHGLALGVTTPAVTNPVDAGRIAGGSSGGSAVAVATGACLLAVGTDTAGSVRIPAACCGVAGLMPRPGRLSRAGVLPGAPSLDSVGLLAGGAGDLALAWAALTGEAAAPGVARAGTVPAEALGRVDDAVVAAAAQAATRLAETGTRVEETEVPPFGAWGRHRAVVIGAEALAVHREQGWWPARAGDYPADVRRQLEEAEGLEAGQVEAAREALAELARALREALAEAGVLIVPTLPVPAPPRAEATGDAAADLRSAGLLTRLCGPVNAAALASLSVPAGDDGLGVQLIAEGERRALAAGAALMQPAATGELR